MSAQSHAGSTGNAVDHLLATYAAGRLAPALHALVAGHLSLRDENHHFVRSLEDSAAAFMEAASPFALDDRDGMLRRIMDDEEKGPSARKPDPLLPDPIAAHFCHAGSTVPWRFMLPGVRRFGLKRDAHGLEAELLWIRAGRRMPSHTHHGSEYTLVLQGAFSDHFGHYRRGDIAIADQEIDHKPIADPGEDCICFAVTDAPLKLTGPVMNFLRRIVGH